MLDPADGPNGDPVRLHASISMLRTAVEASLRANLVTSDADQLSVIQHALFQSMFERTGCTACALRMLRDTANGYEARAK